MLFGLALVITLYSCGGEGQENKTDKVEGRFDVGDHKMWMRCEGEGSPTIVYFHGFIEDSSGGGGNNIGQVQPMLADEHRVCTYDRTNVAMSDDVPGLQTAKSSVTDLHSLLEAAGEEPPYVLLGGSFGGLLMYSYAGTYPDEVTGMVLLEAMVPGTIELEKYFPKGERLWDVDWSYSEEKIDQHDVYLYAEAHGDRVPDIPAVYVLTSPNPGGWGGPQAWEDAMVAEVPEYVATYDPGVLTEVKSPHYMEPVVPGRIAQETELLIERIPEQGAAHDGEGSKK